jgi:hypothetical protein
MLGAWNDDNIQVSSSQQREILRCLVRRATVLALFLNMWHERVEQVSEMQG